MFRSRIIMRKEHMIRKEYAHKIWQLILDRKKAAKKFDDMITPKTTEPEKQKILKDKQKALLDINKDITTLKIKEKLEILNLTA